MQRDGGRAQGVDCYVAQWRGVGSGAETEIREAGVVET